MNVVAAAVISVFGLLGRSLLVCLVDGLLMVCCCRLLLLLLVVVIAVIVAAVVVVAAAFVVAAVDHRVQTFDMLWLMLWSGQRHQK